MLRAFLGRDLEFVNFLVLAFSKDRIPVDLHHWIPKAALKNYQELYFSKAYKLDPFYHAALRGVETGGVFAQGRRAGPVLSERILQKLLSPGAHDRRAWHPVSG